MYKITCITQDKQYDITPILGRFSWQSNIDQLGQQLDFEVAYNDDRYFPINPIDIGSLVILNNNNGEEIFRGIVVTEQKNGRGAIQYTAFDYAFYLNKSKDVFQFNGMAADAAIKAVLGTLGVEIGSIAPISTPITKIYPDDTGADVIRDILDMVAKETGVKHRMEIREGEIYIEEQQDLLITATFQQASNLAPVNITAAISNPSRKRSIEDMKNSIKIICKDNVVSQAQDESLINAYGMLQEVQQIDEKEVAQANQVAANLLKELGKIFEENSIEVPGNDRVRAGRLIEVTEPVTGMSGRYLIKDVTHTVSGGIHTMKLGLGVV